MERIALTANLQDVGHYSLSIPIPITVNDNVDTCIKCLTNGVFMERGGDLPIEGDLSGTPTRLLCIKRKEDEEYSIYAYQDLIHLRREFNGQDNQHRIASNSIVNLEDVKATINGLILTGEILYEP